MDDFTWDLERTYFSPALLLLGSGYSCDTLARFSSLLLSIITMAQYAVIVVYSEQCVAE